jgi:hypothetical protein
VNLADSGQYSVELHTPFGCTAKVKCGSQNVLVFEIRTALSAN